MGEPLGIRLRRRFQEGWDGGELGDQVKGRVGLTEKGRRMEQLEPDVPQSATSDLKQGSMLHFALDPEALTMSGPSY